MSVTVMTRSPSKPFRLSILSDRSLREVSQITLETTVIRFFEASDSSNVRLSGVTVRAASGRVPSSVSLSSQAVPVTMTRSRNR